VYANYTREDERQRNGILHKFLKARGEKGRNKR
jgi:hypothetical protein